MTNHVMRAKKIICKSYEELSTVAAFTVALQIQTKPDSVIGFATGSTPLGAYKLLTKMHKEGTVDFSNVASFNLDEYYPIERTHPGSYYRYMKENLFDHVNISPANIYIPNGECDDPAKECADYDVKLNDLGGTDLQILGIGNNGHIAFVEPGEKLPTATSLVNLTDDTIAANSRFFADKAEQPLTAVSMGLGGIFNSRHILLLISGKGKAEIAKKLLFEEAGTITTQIPASLLNLHPNVTVVVDDTVKGG